MEEKDIIKKKARKAAWLVAISSLAGFSIILFLPSIYFKGGWSLVFIAMYLITIPIALPVVCLTGFITYFIFKRFIKTKTAYRVSLVIFIIIAYPLGVLGEIVTFRALTWTKPSVHERDTNKDGKIDEWIYDNNMLSRFEIDTNYDGKVDRIEHHDNADLIKLEIDTDFDGVMDKVETYKASEHKRRDVIDWNQDGKIDEWRYRDDLLYRCEKDTNGDGKPDLIEYYENDYLIKKEIDTDFDGIMDKTVF